MANLLVTTREICQSESNLTVPVVPKRLPAPGMTLDGDKISAKEKLYESVPSRLCNHPLPPEKPSVMIQQFLKPKLVSDLATVLAESEYLKSFKRPSLMTKITQRCT